MSRFRVSVTLNTKVPIVSNRFGIASLDKLNKSFGVEKVAPLLKSSFLREHASVLERNLFYTYKMEGETTLGLDVMQSSYTGDSHVVRFNRPLKTRFY